MNQDSWFDRPMRQYSCTLGDYEVGTEGPQPEQIPWQANGHHETACRNGPLPPVVWTFVLLVT